MTNANKIAVGLGRAAALGLFVLVVAGLPIAVELSESSEGLRQATVLARTGDAEQITSSVQLSQGLSIALTGGLASASGQESGGESVLRRVMVDEGQLVIDLAAHAMPEASDSAAPAAQAGLATIGRFHAGSVRFRRSTLTIITAGPGRTPYRITDINATLTGARKGTYKLVGSGRFMGQRLNLDGQWSDGPPGSGTARRPIGLSLTGTHLSATLDGVLTFQGQPSLTGTAEINIANLKRVAAWLGISRNLGDHVRVLTISGPVTWSPAQMSFAKAVVEVDDNKATGALTLKTTGQRPSVDATLAFGEIDLANLFKAPVGFATGAMAAAGTRERPQESGEAHLLTHVDADLRLSAGRIRVPMLETGRGAVTVSLNQGKLAANLVGLEIEGGTADGQVTLNANAPGSPLGIRFKAKGFDPGRLLATPLKRNPLLGRANLSFDGTSDGKSPSELMMHLRGRGELELAEPGKLGLDLAALAYAAKTSPVVSWSAAGKGATALDKLKCRFRLTNGAVALETVQARSGDQALFGSGQIDVPGRLIDMNIASGPAAQGEAPATAQVLLSLKGTWEQPAISLLKPATGAAVKGQGALRGH
jgi:AsmA protein